MKHLYSYLKQAKMYFFSKTENRKVKQVLFEGWLASVGRGGYKKRV
jgi:hypothetical protein